MPETEPEPKPVPKFERRKEGEHRRVWFTKEEVDKLAAAALDPYGREDLSHVLLANCLSLK